VKNEIRDFLKAHGVKIVGFGRVPAGLDILELRQVYPSAVVFGYVLSKTVLETIVDRPTLIYKHHYKTVNWLLDQTSCRLASFIEEKGYRAVALPASQIVDWAQHKGHASHRHLAVECGLGHIGRSGLLVHPRHGAQVRYSSVLTDMPFEPDKLAATGCGECVKCIAACPAGAISKDGVDMNLCFARLSAFSSIRGISQHICGVCVKVCDGRD
jgi:epoxyqueuosine reductase QueG